MNDAVDPVDRFLEGLCELELEPEQLRRDPHGDTWLPGSLRAMLADPATGEACGLELREFVAMELALRDGPEPSDAFFTRQVMDRLPEIEAIDERRRTWILASAYALAIGVAYVLIGPLLSSGTLAGYIESVYEWGGAHALEASGVWVALAMLLIAGFLSLAPTERRRAV